MTPSTRRRPASAILAAGVLALTVAVPSGRQASLESAARVLLQEAALPGIDRGLAPDVGPLDPVDRSSRAALVADASGEPLRRLRARLGHREVQGRHDPGASGGPRGRGW